MWWVQVEDGLRARLVPEGLLFEARYGGAEPALTFVPCDQVRAKAYLANPQSDFAWGN